MAAYDGKGSGRFNGFTVSFYFVLFCCRCCGNSYSKLRRAKRQFNDVVTCPFFRMRIYRVMLSSDDGNIRVMEANSKILFSRLLYNTTKKPALMPVVLHSRYYGAFYPRLFARHSISSPSLSLSSFVSP